MRAVAVQLPANRSSDTDGQVLQYASRTHLRAAGQLQR